MAEDAAAVNWGLEGVTVCETALSSIDGAAGELRYRGYDVGELAERTGYEETLSLLWHGELPSPGEAERFADELAADRGLDEGTIELLRGLAAADVAPMAALRSAVSALSVPGRDGTAADPDDAESHRRVGRRLTAAIPTAIAAYDRLRRGGEPVAPREDLAHGANFLYMLTGAVPDAAAAETLDRALVLHADHGINASTFAARVTASTHADVQSAVTSAVGTLSGSLHGGANTAVMGMLDEIDEADAGPAAWVRSALEDERRVPGFGHRVYEVKDPRAAILQERAATLADGATDRRYYEYARAVEAAMAEETGLAPNVDFYSAPTYRQLGIPADLYTALFAMSRVGGWVAHVLEQYADGTLIRPRGRYVGPGKRSLAPEQ